MSTKNTTCEWLNIHFNGTTNAPTGRVEFYRVYFLSNVITHLINGVCYKYYDNMGFCLWEQFVTMKMWREHRIVYEEAIYAILIYGRFQCMTYYPGKHKTDQVSPIYDWMCTKMEIGMPLIIGIASYHAMLYAYIYAEDNNISAKITICWCSVMSLSLIVYPSYLREAIWHRISTITQIMACHRMVPSQFPNKLRRNLIWVFIFYLWRSCSRCLHMQFIIWMYAAV